MAISNTKEVRNRIQNHIKQYQGVRDLRGNIEALKGDRRITTDYQAGLKMVDGGMFAVYYGDVKKILNDKFKINPEKKEYPEEKSWDIYRHLVAREIDRMVNKPRKNASKKAVR